MIDPVLIYSTYLGGSGEEFAEGVAVDSTGNAYVVGYTESSNFPTTSGAYRTTETSGGNSIFVSKLNPTGTALLYSTYLGGGGDEYGTAIAVDSTGDIYITGSSASTNFPTTSGAYRATLPTRTNSYYNAFVTKLSTSLSGSAGLLYSTYLGGGGKDEAWGIAVDNSGNAYVAGQTYSSNFPTSTTALQPTKRGSGSTSDTFVTKLSTTATGTASLLYSTYLGGTGNELGESIAIDSSGNAYVTGYTASSNFTTTLNAYQRTADASDHVYVSKLNPTGSALLYSSYLAGDDSEYSQGLAVDSTGNIYVTGQTYSSNFPTTSGAYRRTRSGHEDIFVAKINPVLSGTTSLVYGTYLGGDGGDQGWGIAVDGEGQAFVTGVTTSTNFATAGAVQTTYSGGDGDSFLLKLSADSTSVLYASYLGGTAYDFGMGVSVDRVGNAYMAGYSTSQDIITTGVGIVQPASGGARDVFVARFNFSFLEFSTQPGSASGAGVALSPQPVVRVKRSDGTTNTAFNEPITLAISPGTGTSGAILGGTATVTAASGVATFSNLSVDRAGNGYRLSASTPLLEVVQSNPFTVTGVVSSTPTISATAGSGQSVPVSTAFATPLEATVRDGSGNPLSGAVVTFTAPSGAGGTPSGTFTGGSASATASTNAAGIATAPAFTANAITGTYTVTATTAGATSPASFTLTNTTAAPTTPASITATAGSNQSTVISTAFATALVATVRDSSSNPVSGTVVTFSAPVSSTQNLPGVPGGFFPGSTVTTTATTGVSGVVTAPIFSANAITGTYSVTASVSGVITPASFVLTNTAAPTTPITGTELVFITQPGGAIASSPFVTQPVVVVQTSQGVTATNYSGAISLTIKSGTGTQGAVLSGTTTLTATNGVASFSGLSIDKVGTGYILIAASGTLTPTESGLFDVITPTTGTAPASITASGGITQSTIISKAFAVQLEALVTDSSGNPVPGIAVTFTAPLPPTSETVTSTSTITSAQRLASGTFATGNTYTTTVTTSASGIVSAPVFTANSFAGTYTVTAVVSGVTAPAVYTLTNLDIPSAPISLTATAGNGQIELSWVTPVYTGGASISGYNLYRLQNNNPVKLNTNLLTSTTYLDTSLTNGTEYFYMVTSLNSVGESGFSFWTRAIPSSGQPVQAAPALVFAVGRDGEVTVEWKPKPIDNRPQATGYNVYRQQGSGSTVKVATVPASQLQYTDGNLTNSSLYTYTVTAINSAGESFPSNQRSATPKPVELVPGEVNLTTATGGVRQVFLGWSAPSGSAGAPIVSGYNVYRLDEQNVPVKLNATPLSVGTTTYNDSGLAAATSYRYIVRAINPNGEGAISNIREATTQSGDSLLSPPPTGSSPATNFYSSTTFVYSGTGAVQTGVAPGTIQPHRVAVLRGRVVKSDGNPLPDVTISVLNQAEYGSTKTQSDGWFDLAVNGGGLLTINYQKEGYLASQRQTNPGWQNFAVLNEVTLIAYDTKVTNVTIGAGATTMQVVQGTPVTDERGSRTATLLFPLGTTATFKMPDGSMQAVASSSIKVRATEYTVGERGPSAMPGELPTFSGYTYAAEFSVDEAVAVGASEVKFSKPIINYTNNYLGFPVGSVVPVGYYNREIGKWVPDTNGLVIKIMREEAGRAVLDVTGDSVEDTGQLLTNLGVTDAELERLAELYNAGQSLWRVTTDHFTPYDCNWPMVASPALNPFGCCSDLPDTVSESVEFEGTNSTLTSSSRVSSKNARSASDTGATRSLPISSTNFSLNYQNSWLESGKTWRRTLVNSEVPTNLIRIDVALIIAGRVIEQSLLPAPNQRFDFVWDGKDAYGRTVTEKQFYEVVVNYVYPLVYVLPIATARAFGLPSERIVYHPTLGEAVLFPSPVGATTATTYRENGFLGVRETRSLGLGGWTLDINHYHNVRNGTLYLGNGTTRTAEDGRVKTIAGIGANGPLVNAVSNARALTLGPDNTIYIVDDTLIKRITPDGTVTTIAGGGNIEEGEDIPATSVFFKSPDALTLGPDNVLYVSDSGTHLIHKISLSPTSNKITKVTGVVEKQPRYSGGYDYFGGLDGDNGLAINAHIRLPGGLTVAPDGSLYVADTGNQRLRKVSTDKFINTVAGKGNEQNTGGDNSTAFLSSLSIPEATAIGPDGSVYIADNNRLRRITPSGIITTVAGSEDEGFAGDGGPANQAKFSGIRSLWVQKDGTIYLVDSGNRRIRRIDPKGIITTVVGSGFSGTQGDGDLPTNTQINPFDVAVSPTGIIYFTDGRSLRRVEPVLPGFSNTDYVIPSENGSQVYEFDNTGRHLRTLNAQNQNVIYKFVYNNVGQLTAVTGNNNNNLLNISRDSSGNPVTIVSASGVTSTLLLNVDGYLDRIITTPPGGTVQSLIKGDQRNAFASTTFSEGDSDDGSSNSYGTNGELLGSRTLTDVVTLGGCYSGDVRSTQFFDVGPVSEQMPCMRVNTSSHNFTASTVDLSIASPSGAPQMGLVFGRNYNSMEVITKETTIVTKTLFGKSGWRHSYQWDLEENGDATTITITTPSGRRDVYKKIDATSYRTPRLTDATLEKQSEGAYTLTDLDMMVYKFMEGKLESITDRNNYRIKLSYTDHIISRVDLCLANNPNCTQGAQYFVITSVGKFISSVIDHTGRKVQYNYGNDLLNSVIDANTKITTMAYETKFISRTQSYVLNYITAPNSKRIITLVSDADGRAQKVIDGLQQEVVIGYKQVAVEQTIKATIIKNIREHEYIYCWDTLYRTLRIINPEGSVTDISYDRRDHTKTVKDPNNRLTTYEYYPAGNPNHDLLKSISRQVSVNGTSQNYIWSFEYNGRNQPTKSTTPNLAVTEYKYGLDQNNPSQMVDPELNTINYTYVSGLPGRVQIATASNNLVTEYSYNIYGYPSQIKQTFNTLLSPPANNLASVSYYTDLNYDGLGRIKKQSDPYISTAGLAVSYDYDNIGHLISVTNQITQTAGYKYDVVGNLEKVTNFLGQETSYAYDAGNQLITTTQNLLKDDIVSKYGYQRGVMLLHTDPNSTVTSFGYDKMDRVTSVSTPLKQGGAVKSSYKYDRVGNRLEERRGNDSGEQTTCYKYDEVDRPFEITLSCAAFKYKVTNVFDKAGNVTTQRRTVKGGEETVLIAQYDRLNRPTSYSLANQGGSVATINTSYSYADNQNKVTVTDPASRVTVVQNDALGRPVINTFGSGTVEQKTYIYYNPTGQAETVINPEAFWTRTNYDGLQRPRAIGRSTQPGSASPVLTTTLHYFEENARPYIVTIGAAPHFQTQVSYLDEAGRIVQERNDVYDEFGKSLDTYYEHDRRGNVTSLTNPNGHQVRYSYENTDTLIKTEQTLTLFPVAGGSQPQNLVTSYDRDKAGNLTKITDGNQNITRFEYDTLNRLTKQKDHFGNTTSYEYDGLNRRVAMVDAEQNRTEYTYDHASYLRKQISSGGKGITVTAEYTTNALGQPLTMKDTVDGAPENTIYNYDALARLQTVNSALGEVNYNYDKLNRRISLDFNRGSLSPSRSITYTYDGLDRLAEMAEQGENFFTYKYTGERLDQLLYPTPGYTHNAEKRPTLTYSYDGAGRLTGMVDRQVNGSLNFAIGYSLDRLGNRTSASEQYSGQLDNGGGLNVERFLDYRYDELSRLYYNRNWQKISAADNTSLVYRYEYDKAGNRKASRIWDERNQKPLEETTSTYDQVNRLSTQLLRVEATNNLPVITTTSNFYYDRNSNLSEQKASNEVVTYTNRVNERDAFSAVYTTSTGYNYNNSYDARNRLIDWSQAITNVTEISSTTVLTPTSGPTVVLGPVMSQTTSLVTQTSQMRYNGMNARTFLLYTHPADPKQTLQTTYLQDLGAPLPVVLQENTTNLTKGVNSWSSFSYVYQPGMSAPFLINSKNSTTLYPGKQYNHLDGLGSVRFSTNGATEEGHISDYYLYADPFGSAVRSRASYEKALAEKKPQEGDRDNPHLFAGEQRDQTSQRDYQRFRYNDAKLGTFTQRDSYPGNPYNAGSLNRFASANSNPVNYTDPSGHWGVLGVTALVLGAAFLAWDTYDLVNIWNDPEASGWEKGLSVGLYAANFVPFGGAAKRGAKLAGGAENGLRGAGRAETALEAGQTINRAEDAGMVGGRAADSCRVGGSLTNSFVAGTMVATEQGLRPIEELKIGDKVWAKDPMTGEQGYHAITWLTNHSAEEVVQITVADQSSNSLKVAAGILLASELGSASGSSSGPAPNQEVIEATSAHPVWVVGKGWTDAGKLVSGDKLLARDGWLLTVSGTKLVKKSVQVYNFTVDQLHTYFVGQQQALVHNVSVCKTWNAFQHTYPIKSNTGYVKNVKTQLSAKQNAAAAWEGYKDSRDAITTLVIGKLDDTKAAADKGYSRLFRDVWSKDVNNAWVQGGIDSKKPFLQVSPRTPDFLQRKDANGNFTNLPTVFAEERAMLFKAGYTEQGDYLIPPR